MTRDEGKAETMELVRFEGLVDAYGAEPDAWPEQEREGALVLLEQSEQARTMLEQASALDRLLDLAPMPERSAALRQRVLAAAPQPRGSWLERLDGWAERWWPFTPRWQPAMALAAAAVLGVVVGSSLPENGTTSEPLDVAELAYGSDAELEASNGSEMP